MITANYPSFASHGSRRIAAPPPAGGGGGTPTWLSSIATLTWTQLTGTSLSSVIAADPGSGSGSIASFSGACVKRSGSELFLAGGGHSDRAGNDVYSLRFANNSLAWVKRRNPTASVTFNVAHYSDGRPSARHTYFDLQYDDAADKMIFVGAATVWGTAVQFSDVDAFDPTVDDYVTAGTYPTGTGGFQGNNVASGCCRDTVNNIIWWQRNDNGDIYKLNPTTKVWTNYASGAYTSHSYGTTWAHDPVRSRILRVSNITGTPNPKYYDNLTGTPAEHNVTYGGAQSGALNDNCMAFYCEALDVYIAKKFTSQTLYQIDPATFAVTTLSVSGGPPPSDIASGTYGRFNYLPDLNVIVYVPDYNVNCWIVRLP